MINHIEQTLLLDEGVINHNGIKFILECLFSKEPYILFFLSPEVNVKSSILKRIIQKYKTQIPEYLFFKLNLLAMDFKADDILHTSINSITEDNLVKIYACYAKSRNLPQDIVKALLEASKDKEYEKRVLFLINILLAHYFLQNNNFDLADTHIKHCIEYINYNIEQNEYENMVAYVICGKYLERTKDIFLSYADNYYKLAADIALDIKDSISLAAIYSNLSYYYHNVEKRELAADCSNKALELANALKIPEIYFNVYKILGILSLTSGDYKGTTEYMKKSIEFSEQIEDFSIMEAIKLKNSLGYIYYLKGSFEDALKIHLDAFASLSWTSNGSEVLDEAVKTFDNLSNSFKMLGDIKKSIYFSEITTKIIKDCNYGHRINDIQNLCKQYTDLGLIYGLYLNDYKNAQKYYDLAKSNISPNDHYIKLGNLSILEAYVKLTPGNDQDGLTSFNNAVNIFTQYGSSNIYVQSLLIPYYVYFSQRFKELEGQLVKKAEQISHNFNLKEHFNFAVELFIHNKTFKETEFDSRKYPLNLILMLSEERKHSLAEGKKARDFELIQDFSNNISLVLTEDSLFQESHKHFNKYFLSKGFAAITHDFNGNMNSKIEVNSDLQEDKKLIIGYFENFVKEKNLLLNSHGRKYDIFDFGNDTSDCVRSMLVYYVYDDINFLNYYFIVFYDKKLDWLFTEEDAEVGLILIKNLFLKLKTIHYTEQIKNNSLTDYATGLFNGKYMWDRLDNTIMKNSNNPLGFSLAIMDLNGFKSINDTYGHYAGDEAIRFFSKVLKIVIGSSNSIIRYGGDEFVIIFPGLSKDEAELQISEIKILCEKQPFLFMDNKIFMSFSYGIANFKESNITKEDCFNFVDNLMYIEKEKNRSKNRGCQ